MRSNDYTQADFARNPLMFYYEVTQACDLVCQHCRASAQEEADAKELSGAQSMALIDQVATFPRRPTLVLTGGDPLKRLDIFDLVRHAVSVGLEVALTPSATPLATFEALRAAKEAGVQALGISLDGPDAKTHDAFRGWDGSFERTLKMLDHARELGFAVQVNTSVTRRNFAKIDAMANLLTTRGVTMWSVFFLVPVGRGADQERITAEEYEVVFERLWHHARQQPYAVKTTEAPHYRRYVIQNNGQRPSGSNQEPAKFAAGNQRKGGRGHRAPLGVWDGKGVMFVSHTGEIYPSGFLPLACGCFPAASVVDAYQNHATFAALRKPDEFLGKCGICEFRSICGGSRARAYAVTGNPLESEPDCVYEPK